MIKLHPEILKKNGKSEFVVLPYEEFVAIQELLDDAQDLLELERARQAEGDAPTVSFEELAKRFGLPQETQGT
jgi:hypothetical protein